MSARRRLRGALARLLGLGTRRSDEARMHEEMAFHLERLVERYRTEGLSSAEAHRRARVAFGGVEVHKESSREALRSVLVENAARDIRHAVRALRRSPGFMLAAVLTLGLGIGANATMFGIVDRLLLRPPPYLAQAGRVHRVYFMETWDGVERADPSTSYRRYRDVQRETRSFDVVAEGMEVPLPVDHGDQTQEHQVLGVTASYWRLFAMRPVVGHFFEETEDAPPIGTPVAVLGYAYWRSRFGGRTDVVGHTMAIGRRTYTIVGVAPAGFSGTSLRAPAAIIPLISTLYELGRDPTRLGEYEWGWPEVFVRRRPGVSLTEADADLTRAFQLSYNQEHIENPASPAADVIRPRAVAAPVQRNRAPDEARAHIPTAGTARTALWLTGVALLVLLIACANVGNLLLARAFGRRREIAVRLALGVSRPRLVAQLLTESLLLAGLGSLAGLAVAEAGDGVLGATLIPDIRGASAVTDPRVLAVGAGLALLAGLLAGLAPVLFARRTDVAAALRAGGRGGTDRRSTARAGLLIVQGALSAVLLIGAGLFVRSLYLVERLPLGYDADQLLYVQPVTPGMTARAVDQLDGRLNTLAAGLPGIEGSTRAASVPLASYWGFHVFVPGLDTSYVDHLGQIDAQAGSPPFFNVVGTRIVRGRGFDEGDRKGAPMVVVVSTSLAKTFWPGRNPLGRCMRIRADTAPCRTVVGVAEDAAYHDLRRPTGLAYYIPIAQWGRPTESLFLRTRGDPAASAETVRKALQVATPNGAYVVVTPVASLVGTRTQQWKLGATMFLIFGALAVLVAAIGLYSVTAYGVAQRSKELGVRASLGASRTDLVRLVLGGGMRQAFAAVGLGLAMALGAAPWVTPLLFHTSPRDPLVFGAVAVLLAVVSVAASALPALRAARVDPAAVLREE